MIKDCFGFYPIRSVIGQENSRHFRNQSDAEPKLTATWSPAFFPRFSLVVFTLSSHRLLKVFSFLLIGCCDYFVSGFTTVNRKTP